MLSYERSVQVMAPPADVLRVLEDLLHYQVSAHTLRMRPTYAPHAERMC